jgi:hypothetical protein
MINLGTGIVVSLIVLVPPGTARLRNSHLLKSLTSLPRALMSQPECGPHVPEDTPWVLAVNLGPYRGGGSRVNRQTARRNAFPSMRGTPDAGNGYEACQEKILKSSVALSADSVSPIPHNLRVIIRLNFS